MLPERIDSVHNIHKRWLFTRINPSSYKASFLISIASAIVIIIVAHIDVINTRQLDLLLYLPLGLFVSVILNFLDYIALRGTSLNKFTKILHVSAFSNVLWTLVVLLGIASNVIMTKPSDTYGYVLEGMLLAVGFRAAIFNSVFGAQIGRALAVSFIQPFIFFAAIVPFSFFRIISEPVSIGFGCSLIMLGVVWSIMADRSGRPYVKSTFALLQAFLSAWTEKNPDRMEEITESRSHIELVTTQIAKFNLKDSNEVALVLPGVHPGPFNPIGGSNLPFILYELFANKALIMHSVSDHSLNIPSLTELQKYVRTIPKAKVLDKQNSCTVPTMINIDKCTVTGISFGTTAILFLSMAPKGMEDVPLGVRMQLEDYSSHIGFSQTLVVDTHNAMGPELSKAESGTLILAGKQCLEKLKNAKQYDFKVGFANLDNISGKPLHFEEIGGAGLAAMTIEVKGNRYVIGWADSNNMTNGLREHIISNLRENGIEMLEVCTSDTHSTSGKRTLHGYYALGNLTKLGEVCELYLQLSISSIQKAMPSTFELLSAQSEIKVMGENQFNEYSVVLDRAMRLTKLFLLITITTIFLMLLFS